MKKAFMLVLIFLISLSTFADAKGEAIARKYFDLKSADDDFAIATMVLIDKKNNKKTRKLEIFAKEFTEGKNTFIRFLEPSDVKNTTFLTITHKNTDDEQRLYLPALKKVRRISSSSKDSKFMGSDLFYYDMEDKDYDDFTFKYLKDEEFRNMDCYVLEMKAKDPNSPYLKTKVWINKSDNFIYKTECYDKKRGGLIKTMVIVETRIIDGVIFPIKTLIENHQEQHKTLLSMDNIKINSGLKDNIFTVQNLEK
ncbi:MAG: outer membrane lipoprotein-sorting protein [Spirochaetes bacterium]|nr:outer membrane lipoprotein-sorting protein [Spirochaetota bacterium]